MGFRIGDESVINLKSCEPLSVENLKELLKSVKENNKYGDIIWCDVLPEDQESKKLIQEIEKQLEYNNVNFTRFPSDYLHALFSHIVYYDLKKNDKLDKLELDLDEKTKHVQELNGWEVSKVFSEPKEDKGLVKKGSIYFGALFINKYKNQMVLAHRGINADWLSWFKKESPVMTNLSGIMLNESVPQMLCCYKIVEHVIKEYAKNKDYESYYLSFTGYGNGAWLAQYSTYYSHYYFNYEKCKAVLFESPGFFKNEQSLSSNIISPESDIYLGDMNVVSYLTTPNLTNSCNKHVGIVYRVFLEDDDGMKNQKVENDENSEKFIDKFFDSFKLFDDIKSKVINSKFLIWGLFNMFSRKNLNRIIKLFDTETGKPFYYEQMLDWPLAGINFDKDYQENVNKYLINTPIEKIVDNIPLAKILPEIFLDVTKKGLNFIASTTVDKAVEFIAPGLYIFLNIFIETCKGNMNLDHFENDLFNKKLTELDEITSSEDYIDYTYSPDQDEKVKERFSKRIIKKLKPNFAKTKEEKENDKIKKETETKMHLKEKNLEKKFKLLDSYKPRHVSNYSKVLNINSDKENIDYCLNNLNSCLTLNEENKLSDLVKKQLIELKDLYDIKPEINEPKETICFIYSKNKSFTIETIKERLERLLSLNGLLIKKIIKQVIYQVITPKNILSSNFLMEDMTNQYVPIIDFKNIYSKFLTESKKKILIYGPKGFGKSVFASQFGRYFCKQKPNEQICLSFQMGSKKAIKTSYLGSMVKRLEIKDVKSQKNKIKIINDKLSNLSVENILFIFDDVKFDDSFELIKEIIQDLPEKICVLFTSRVDDKSFHSHFDHVEKAKEFNKQQAYDLFKKSLSHKKGKIESIMSKLDEMGQINGDGIIPLKLENIIRYVDLQKNKTIDTIIKSIKLDDMNIYEDLFDELINNELDETVKCLIKTLAFLHVEKITFNFLKTIVDDEDLIDLTLKKLRNNSILYESDYYDDDDEIFFNIEHTLQVELLNYLKRKQLKESIVELVLEKILNYYQDLNNEDFASVKLYELDHCISIMKHGDRNSDNFTGSFSFFTESINNLARSLRNATKYEEAIEYYEKLVDIEKIRNDESEMYAIFKSLEKCHSQIGNESEASYYKAKLKEIKDFISDDDNFDNREEGEDPYKDVIPNLDEIKEQQKRAEMFYNIGFNSKRMKKFYEAFIFFEQSFYIKVYINGSIDSIFITKLKTNLKECYERFKQSKQTAGYEEKIKELDEKVVNLKLNYENRNDQRPTSSACVVS